MAGTNSVLIDIISAPEEQQDSGWITMEEFLSNLFLADKQDEGTSSNEQPGHCPFNIPKLLRTKTFDEVFSEMIDYCDSNDQGPTTNPASSPKAFENITLENFLARAGVFTDDVQEPPPQQTRYKNGIKERRRLRVVKNRELAAQFRANKRAKVEEAHLQLEEELYVLREENKHLKLLMKNEEELARAKAAMQAKAKEKPTAMRRVNSTPR